jgi:flagellar basal body-associated protein FliL
MIMVSREPEEKGDRLNAEELDEREVEAEGVPPKPPDSKNPEQEHSEKDDSGERDDIEASSAPQLGSARKRQKTHGGRKWLWIVLVALLCVLVGGGLLYVKKETSNLLPNQERQTALAVKVSVPQEHLLSFDPFVVPVPVNRKFTYIFLSISFKLPNKEIKREMIQRRSQLRGIIYEVLAGKVRESRELPALDHLKGLIIRELERSLYTGNLGEVYITKFLAV